MQAMENGSRWRLTGASLTIIALGCLPAAGGGSDVVEHPESGQAVATWREGAVDRDTYESWLRFQGQPGDVQAGAVVVEEVEQMLLVETLAAAAMARGADDDPALEFALTREDANVLAQALRRHTAARVEVEEAAIAAQVAAQPELRTRPRKLRLRNIFKSTFGLATDEERSVVRQRMDEILAELRGGADFAALARRESDSQTRFQGGLIGNIEPDRLAAEIRDVAETLAAGDLSGVIETADGLMILRCDEVLEEVQRTAEEVRAMVSAHLRRQAERQAWARQGEALLAAAEPQWNLAAARDSTAGPEAVVASFEGGRVQRRELDLLAAARPGSASTAGLDDASLTQLLESWIVTRMAAARARRMGLDHDPDVVARRHWSRLRLLAGAELGHLVENDFEPPTEAEAKAYFAAHPARFQRPPEFDLDVIAITLPAGEERERYRLAQRLQAELASGVTEFAAAARAHSEHPSAAAGGGLGWLARPQLAPLGARPTKVVQALEPGEISELVQNERTAYIFRLRGRREAQDRPWDEVAAAVDRALGRERAEALRARIEQRLRRALDVRVGD